MVKTLKCFSDYVTHCLLLWAMPEEVGVGWEGARGEGVFGVYSRFGRAMCNLPLINIKMFNPTY